MPLQLDKLQLIRPPKLLKQTPLLTTQPDLWLGQPLRQPCLSKPMGKTDPSVSNKASFLSHDYSYYRNCIDSRLHSLLQYLIQTDSHVTHHEFQILKLVSDYFVACCYTLLTVWLVLYLTSLNVILWSPTDTLLFGCVCLNAGWVVQFKGLSPLPSDIFSHIEMHF